MVSSTVGGERLRIVATYTHDLWDFVSFEKVRYEYCSFVVVCIPTSF
jgi:hypothetical protein